MGINTIAVCEPTQSYALTMVLWHELHINKAIWYLFESLWVHKALVLFSRAAVLSQLVAYVALKGMKRIFRRLFVPSHSGQEREVIINFT